MSLPLMTGTYIGTGSLLTVNCGFRPKRVELVNITDPAIILQLDKMPAASAMVGTDTFVSVTSNGITITDEGFTVGTDATMNTSAEQVHWCCMG